jgi:DNA repair exonuclease SbcCD ATPase subunit
MSLKTIFHEGMKERKRRKSLGKVSGESKDKEKALAGQLTALGRKAWEAKVDIAAFSELRTGLGETQKVLDGLQAGAAELQKLKQESEAEKKRESERLAAAQKEIDDKNRATGKRLAEQKDTLQEGEKESRRAKNRLTAIAGERTQLQNKAADPAAVEAEKTEIARSLELLAQEEEGLNAAIKAGEDTGKPVAALVASLQEESGRLQKQLEDLRYEQKKIVSELDKKISALNSDLAKNREKAREAEDRQQNNYHDLGEKLVPAQSVDPNISQEMAAVLKARTEMEGIQSLIGGLERQKDAAQVSAYKKMMAIMIGGIVLLAAIIASLFFLLLSAGK